MITFFHFFVYALFRVSVPVVTSLYLLGRVWWVLCGMERDGTVLAKEDDTKEDVEIADDTNGNNNGKHLERYNINNC